MCVAAGVLVNTPGPASARPRPRPHAVPFPDFSVGDVAVVEPPVGQTVDATFTVTLSAVPARRMHLLVRTSNGSARRERRDYERIERWLVFNPNGPVSKTVTVRVRGDAVAEGPETFRLVARHGRTVRFGTATILPPGSTPPVDPPVTPPVDPPPPPPPPVVPTVAMTVTNDSVFEPATGGLSDGTVTLAPVAPLAHDLVVDYTLVGIDATSGVDFQQQHGTLVFPAGSTAAQSVVVTVVGDETVEPDETFHVQFAVADDAATLDPSFATVTIVDDDSRGGGSPVDPL